MSSTPTTSKDVEAQLSDLSANLYNLITATEDIAEQLRRIRTRPSATDLTTLTSFCDELEGIEITVRTCDGQTHHGTLFKRVQTAMMLNASGPEGILIPLSMISAISWTTEAVQKLKNERD